MAKIMAQMEHASGIPLGGLGTGSVEIRPDGYFHEWQIFNVGSWAPWQPECCGKPKIPDMSHRSLAFYVRTQQGDAAPLVRRLGLRSDQNEMYSFTWCKSARAVEFDGRFPVANLKYIDDDLPVSVSATVFSPFVPHDARTSGTPGFHVAFEIKNKSRKPVDVSLLGTLLNPVVSGTPDRQLVNSITHAGDATFLTMRTEMKTECKPSLGSFGMSVSGGENTWLAGEYEDYLHHGYLLWSRRFGIVKESLIREFRTDGRLPNAEEPRSYTGLLRCTEGEIDAMPEAERSRVFEALCRYPLFGGIAKRISEAEPDFLKADAGRTEFLKDARETMNHIYGEKRTFQAWGGGALCSSIRLGPRESKEIDFTIGWHFPYHYSEKGTVLGHMYEHWFEDAESVNRFLVKNREKHRESARGFADTLYDTSLEPELADAWSGQLTTLVKCTWWTKAGDFAVWEGLGCCGFHTTDITYQGSFGLLALFPELQKRQMEMGARFQREDGRVHHFFRPDLSAVDEGFDRVDMNQQFVLLVCRDYLWTGDLDYLGRMWPHIVRAMDNTRRLDTDGDGLPDHDTRRNTYDAWDMRGTPSYIASLWLSALLAAARVADDLGETGRAKEWRDILAAGVESFERKLWNGEYYSLWVDGDERDECCMTDQIDGEWFTQLVGLGHTLPAERIKAALRAVVRHNFLAEDGLINAHYPPGARPTLYTWHNLQADAPWTGIEYAIASMMFDFGLAKEAVAVVKNVHERYYRAGRFWNHVECGDHYYRAMSAWAVLLGATGFKIDVPSGTLVIAPAVRRAAVRAPWVSSSGWGSFSRKKGRFEMTCRAGSVAFKALRLDVAGASSVLVNDRKRAVAVSEMDGLTEFKLRAALTLKAGDVLTVE